MKTCRTPHELEFMPILVKGNVVHYTCNAPKKDILNKEGIICLGNRFGCDNGREVLKIPKEKDINRGFSPEIFKDKNLLNYNTELLIRKIGKEVI